MDVLSEKIVKNFSSDACKAFAACVPSGISFLKKNCCFLLLFVAYIPSFFLITSGPGWSIGDNISASMDAGLLTSKVICLIESLLEYRLA